MFLEKGLEPHLYLLIAGIVFIILFFGYIFWFDHKENVKGGFRKMFEKEGLEPQQISDISHDDSMWYYQRVSTCVGYGDPLDECPKHESYCAGGDNFGEMKQQAYAVANAIKKGGVHEECPLIYSGAD